MLVEAGSGRRAIAVEAQGNLLAIAVKSDAAPRKGGGIRGLVYGFSRASRLRMIKKMNRLRPDNVKFITLTYPARYPRPDEAKKHLRALFERFRRAYPKSSAIWRLEYQERGAPHFHLICFNMPFLPFHELRNMWSEIIYKYVDLQLPFVRIEKLKSNRGALYYVSKYVAKMSDDGAVAGALLNLDAYLHAGRVWGVFNSQFLPFAPKVYITILDREPRSAAECKKLMRRHYAYMNKQRDKGGVIFTEKAYSLHNALIRLLIKYADPLTDGFDHVELGI